MEATAALADRAVKAGIPAVGVVVAARSSAPGDLLLPASLQAFEEAPIYARTNGYLSKWLVDIGDEVKTGQVLAIIEGPEVDQELNQARAALDQAKANLALAASSATRWKDLGTQNAVAQQEVDEKQADLLARGADVHAAEANVSRLTQLKQYQTITAPFDGVISARNVDIGALVTAGGGGRELFRLAQTKVLRVYASVPQTNSRAIKPGLDAEVLVNEFPGRVFKGKVVRIAGALDPNSRTLETEVQIPNENGELFAGMFGQVRFRLTPTEPAILIPSGSVIILANGAQVLTVTPNPHVIRTMPIKLGRDFGTQIEVLSGLPAGTLVVSTPNDGLVDGMTVDPVLPVPAKKA